MASSTEVIREPSTQHEIRHLRLKPSRGWIHINFREIWEFRELLYFLTWRDIKIRYKQTALGAAWAILQPFLQMVVFTLFFGRLAKISSDGVPYPIFSYAGLLPWTYFSTSLTNASNSLVSNAQMITKVYFPRLIVPISAVLSGLVDFAVSFIVLIAMMVYYQVWPSWPAILLLPAFLLLAFITALGVSLWTSAMNVTYRDVRYVIPFLVQFWMFATPVIYPSKMLAELGQPWVTLYGLNPMVGVVEGFRWALIGSNPPEMTILLSAVVAVIILVSGLYYFRRTEKNFADII